MARRSKVPSGKQALTDLIILRIVVPAVKKQARKHARRAVKNKTVAGANALKDHPVRTGIAVGALFGAVSYVVDRARSERCECGGDGCCR